MKLTQRIAVLWGINKSCIEKETEKARLINGLGWIPKSQSELGSKDQNSFMLIPLWLAYKIIPQHANELELSTKELDTLLHHI